MAITHKTMTNANSHSCPEHGTMLCTLNVICCLFIIISDTKRNFFRHKFSLISENLNNKLLITQRGSFSNYSFFINRVERGSNVRGRLLLGRNTSSPLWFRMLHNDNLYAVASVRGWDTLSLVPCARLSVEITEDRAWNPTGDLFATASRHANSRLEAAKKSA